MKRKNKGVSAVVGVIIMVSVTFAVAAVVYVYVEGLTNEMQNEDIFEYTGILQEVKSNSLKQNEIVMNNHTMNVDGDIGQLTCLLGQNITVILRHTPDNYEYVGVRINI